MGINIIVEIMVISMDMPKMLKEKPLFENDCIYEELSFWRLIKSMKTIRYRLLITCL